MEECGLKLEDLLAHPGNSLCPSQWPKSGVWRIPCDMHCTFQCVMQKSHLCDMSKLIWMSDVQLSSK